MEALQYLQFALFDIDQPFFLPDDIVLVQPQRLRQVQSPHPTLLLW